MRGYSGSGGRLEGWQRRLIACLLAGLVLVGLASVPSAHAAGPAASITLKLSASTLTADGSSSITATATVTDASSNPVQNETVDISSTDSGESISPSSGPTDVNGNFSATITSSTKAGSVVITATDTSTTGITPATQQLQQVAGPAAHISLGLNPTQIVADGSSQATATATVTDANLNPVTTDTVSFTSSDPGEGISPTTNNNDGTYTAKITSSKQAGSPTITAHDGALSASQTLQQTPGTAASVALAPISPSQIVADGVSHATATATVTDSSGNPVTGENVTFSSTLGDTFSGTTDNGNGTYTATITTTAVGTATITAHDGALTSTGQGLAQVAGPAAKVSLAPISPSSILANGKSQATATATVTDSVGHPLTGEAVTFSSNLGNTFSATTNNGNGTYTATVTSSTTLGTATITAHDGGLSSTGQALDQTIGPPATISLLVSPGSIKSDGVATTTGTATVADSAGHGISGQHVTFSSSDPGQSISLVTDNLNGTYSVTITSDANLTTPCTTNPLPGVTCSTITATDTAITGGPTSASQTLRQTSIPSTTTLVASPSTVSTNQGVTLIANVTSATYAAASGSVTFLAGPYPVCSNVAVSASNPVAVCNVAFPATSSPVPLQAVFTPDSSSNAYGSSASASVTVVKGSTSTSVTPSNYNPHVDISETFTASVTAGYQGATAPTGSVKFLQGGKPIASCSSVKLGPLATASCTLTYRAPGTHSITAVYSGDGNFNGSKTSGPLTISFLPQGHVRSTMTWSFAFHPGYTTIGLLQVNGAGVGMNVLIRCKGHSCPFRRHMTTLRRGFRCTRSGRHKCGSTGPLGLGVIFRGHHLSPGTTIIVEISRPGYVGKFYSFTMRAGRAPMILQNCLAPGINKPGVDCS